MKTTHMLNLILTHILIGFLLLSIFTRKIADDSKYALEAILLLSIFGVIMFWTFIIIENWKKK
jgi:uncharacterized membrane protein